MKKIFFFLVVIFITSFVLKPITNKSEAQAEQYQGLYIFTDCKPTSPYDYLGNVKVGLTMGDVQYTGVRDKMIKKCKKDYPSADGLILHFVSGGTDKGDAIKFKE